MAQKYKEVQQREAGRYAAKYLLGHSLYQSRYPDDEDFAKQMVTNDQSEAITSALLIH